MAGSAGMGGQEFSERITMNPFFFNSVVFLDLKEKVLHKLINLKWWFLHRFHPKHRYHVIHTGLEPGWRDRDTLMEHLLVKILRDFIEKEMPVEYISIEESLNIKEWIRLKELYLFFKENDYLDMEYDELTPLLVEIVQLRKLMWT